MIKAIPTEYAGVRFRSRLEAKWAAAFDERDTKWRYEVEGFDFDGVWYLPDFWLPDKKCFVEVKHAAEACDGKALLLARASALRRLPDPIFNGRHVYLGDGEGQFHLAMATTMARLGWQWFNKVQYCYRCKFTPTAHWVSNGCPRCDDPMGVRHLHNFKLNNGR